MQLFVKTCSRSRFVLPLSIVFAFCVCLRIGWPSQKVNASTLPSPWADSDIGAVDSGGSASYSNGAFTITACGADIYNTADAFHYVYQPLNGDGQIVARVASVQNVSNWSKAGVMIRQTLDADSSQAMMMVTPGKGIDLQFRTATGGQSSSVSGPANTAPFWIALTRTGSTITGYYSTDGINWSVLVSETISMPSSVYVGLALTSHNPAAACTSVIDSVIVNGTPVFGSPDQSLLSDSFSGSAIDTTKWNTGNLFSGFTDATVPMSQSGGQLSIGPLPRNASGSHYNGVVSKSTYNLSGAYVSVEVAQPPSSSTAADAMLTVGSDGNDFYRIYVEAGNLIGQKKVGGNKIQLFSTAYSSTNFKYLRIRNDSTSGKVSFETSAVVAGIPGPWTSQYSEQWNTSSIPLSAIEFEVKAGTWQAEANAPGTVGFNNFLAGVHTTAAGGSPPPPPPGNPSVTVSASQHSGAAPLPISFTSTASSPNGAIQSYAWTFGDGQIGTGASVAHTYSSTGSFTAGLTVTDTAGKTATASTNITVSPAVGQSGGGTLRVVQYNIDFTEGTDCIDNPQRTASTIASLSPDVVSMAEVWQPAMAQQIATLLGQDTGQTWYVFTAPLYSGAQQVEAVLSRFPILGSSYQFLTGGLVVCQIQVNVNGVNVNYFGTQLDASSEDNRLSEATEIQQFIAGFSGQNNIIGGDFNEWSDGAVYASMTTNLTDAWVSAMNAGTATAYPDNPVSFNTRTRRTRIDWILYSGNVGVAGAQVPDTRNLSETVCEPIGTSDDLGVRPSDHDPVEATFTIK